MADAKQNEEAVQPTFHPQILSTTEAGSQSLGSVEASPQPHVQQGSVTHPPYATLRASTERSEQAALLSEIYGLQQQTPQH
jgi:hypothetical protein